MAQKEPSHITNILKSVGLPEFEEQAMFQLLSESAASFQNGPTLVHLNGPVIVVGDIHGSISDLLRIFALYGFPETTKYVFLGDYVDRGDFSIEVLILLLAAHCVYPENICLLRGNHEFRSVCSNYGFRDSVLDLYSPNLFKAFMDVFSFLPLAAVVNDTIFCVHGGLSPLMERLEDIADIQRPIDDWSNKLVEDLMWSDPSKLGACDFRPSSRNRGCIFGSPAVNNFYRSTGITAIIRGHSMVKEGIELYTHLSLASVYSSSCSDQMLSNCGIIHIDEESNISPEILGPVERIQRKDVKFYQNSMVGMPLKKTSTLSRLGGNQFPAAYKYLPRSPKKSKKRSLPTIMFRF